MRSLKLILVGFLISSQSFAGFPPTTAKGQNDTSPTVTFNLQAPNSQSTRINATTALIETGSLNMLTDPSFEASSTGSWQTPGGGSQSYQNATLLPGGGKQALSFALSAATGSVKQDLFPTVAGPGVNLEASMWVNTTVTTAQVCAREAGAEIQCTPVSSDGNWHKYSLNFGAPSSGTIGIDVSTTGTTTGTIFADAAYLGPATNLAQVSQAQLVGGAVIIGCASGWSTTSTSFGDFSTQASCSYATFGQAQAPSTNIPGVKFSSLPPGDYRIEYEGAVNSHVAGKIGYFTASDGTNQAREISEVENTSSTDLFVPSISDTLSYTTAQSNVTLRFQGKVDTGGTAQIYGTTGQPGVIRVYKYPSQSQTALGPDATAASWSGYLTGNNFSTTQTGSFADLNTATGITLTERQNTNFGTVTEYSTNKAGITFTPPRLGKYMVCVSTSWDSSSTTTESHFDIADTAGTPLEASTMSMQQMVVAKAMPLNICGIWKATSIASTSLRIRAYSSSAATINVNDASGNLEWSIFQLDYTQPAPLLTGGVTSSSSGLERVERVRVQPLCTTATCTISSSTPGVSSVTRSSQGNYVVNFSAGTFSAAPTCVAVQSQATSYKVFGPVSPTSTTWSFGCTDTSNVAQDCEFHVLCMGPR